MLRRLLKVVEGCLKNMEKKRPYEKLKFYKDICEIRKFIYNITERFARSHMRLVSQMRDAARSAKQNIREGYRKGSLPEFLNGIRISQGSLEELSGDFEDCFDDDLVTKQESEIFLKMYNSAIYMSTQYLKVMYPPENQAKWKTLKTIALSNKK
jgi:four helix bundle protein